MVPVTVRNTFAESMAHSVDDASRMHRYCVDNGRKMCKFMQKGSTGGCALGARWVQNGCQKALHKCRQ